MADHSTIPTSAGVHFPPPFVYAIGFLIGYGLDRRIRWPIASSAAAGSAVAMGGWTLVVLAVIGAGAALTRFARAHTTVFPHRPARALVVTGIYRFTRNPMYLSLAVLYSGLALLIDSWWPLALLPLVLVIIDRGIIAREERYLLAVFPSRYAEYRRRVRRWL